MSSGSGARAVGFVEITTPARSTLFRVGIHDNIVTASLKAIVSGLNRGRVPPLLALAIEPTADCAHYDIREGVRHAGKNRPGASRRCTYTVWRQN